MARHESVGTLPSDYNMKLGPVYSTSNASVGGRLCGQHRPDQLGPSFRFYVSPQVGIEARWPVTQRQHPEAFHFLGYSKYLIHPQYDTAHLLVAPDSVLSFDVYVGD